jgi:hypothetical protein
MSRKTAFAILALTALATALNLSILILNLSLPSAAAVAGMDAKTLSQDADFKSAVQTVVQACKVNIDLAKIIC